MGQQDCDLKKSADSIFVYTCKESDSRLKSIKAQCRFNCSPAVIAAGVMDVPSYTKWQYHTIAAEVIRKISATEVIYRTEIEAPWPVSNRDLIMHLKIRQDTASGILYIDLKSMPGLLPEKDGVVRVPQAAGHWVITPSGKNEVRIDHTFLVDPGGAVPVWLINLTLADAPHETLLNLKNRIRSGQVILPEKGGKQ